MIAPLEMIELELTFYPYSWENLEPNEFQISKNSENCSFVNGMSMKRPKTLDLYAPHYKSTSHRNIGQKNRCEMWMRFLKFAEEK